MNIHTSFTYPFIIHSPFIVDFHYIDAFVASSFDACVNDEFMSGCTYFNHTLIHNSITTQSSFIQSLIHSFTNIVRMPFSTGHGFNCTCELCEHVYAARVCCWVVANGTLFGISQYSRRQFILIAWRFARVVVSEPKCW